MKVLFSNQMRMLDNNMIIQNKIPGLLLMENAAQGAVQCCMELENSETIYHIFCGVGNNGGDGFAIARHLLVLNKKINLYLIGSQNKIKGDAKINAAYFKKYNMINQIQNTCELEPIFSKISKNDIIIDAIFGIGLNRDIEGLYYDVIADINKSDAKIISIDIPSGVCSDTGQVLNNAINANMTITFQYPKPGHFLFPGRDLKGRLRIHKIGIDENIEITGEVKINAYSKASGELKVKPRKRNSNKGTFGKLALVCSSETMTGAGLLSAKAALRTGVGVLYLGVPECVHRVFQSEVYQAPSTPFRCQDGSFADENKLDELMKGKSALAVGPGITTKPQVVPLIEKALKNYDVPKVFDADALNIISKDITMLENTVGSIVLTPHPLEFSRLIGVNVEQIMKDPISYCIDFAVKHNVNLLLKGSTTIIANPQKEVSLILTGTNGMAKGGSGDVLTGIIGALMAQGYSAYDSAILGAYIAGISGELAKADYSDYSMTLVDAIEKIALAISEYL